MRMKLLRKMATCLSSVYNIMKRILHTYLFPGFGLGDFIRGSYSLFLMTRALGDYQVDIDLGKHPCCTYTGNIIDGDAPASS